MGRAGWDRCLKRMAEAVRAYHEKNPLGVGVARTALSATLGLDAAIFEALVRAALAEKRLAEESGGLLRLAEFRPALNTVDESVARAIERALLVSPLTPPSRQEVLQAAQQVARAQGAENPGLKAQAVLKRLLEQGAVVMVEAPELIFHRKGLAQARHVVISNLLPRLEMETPELRDKLGVSRKWAVPLLDYFDKEGLTLRVESRRRLRESARKRLEEAQREREAGEGETRNAIG
jgi:selenocysteine-specific elongation factor